MSGPGDWRTSKAFVEAQFWWNSNRKFVEQLAQSCVDCLSTESEQTAPRPLSRLCMSFSIKQTYSLRHPLFDEQRDWLKTHTYSPERFNNTCLDFPTVREKAKAVRETMLKWLLWHAAAHDADKPKHSACGVARKPSDDGKRGEWAVTEDEKNRRWQKAQRPSSRCDRE